jgi:hypothetical protein
MSNFFHVRGSRKDNLTPGDKLMMRRVSELRKCMLCGARGDIEVSHSDQITDGKAFGMKSHPVLLAALCHTCHLNNGHARDDKQTAFSDWNLAHKRTIAALYDEGKLKPV